MKKYSLIIALVLLLHNREVKAEEELDLDKII